MRQRWIWVALWLAGMPLSSRAGLDEKWRFPETDENPLPPIYSSPVVSRGVVYFASEGDANAPGYLYALDVNPSQDLDGDGTAEDASRDPTAPGYPSNPPANPAYLDISLGRRYDLIWRAPLAGSPGYNTPAVVHTTYNGLPIQVVYITTRDPFGNGRIEAFYATLTPSINRQLGLTPGQRMPGWNPPVIPQVAAISSPVVHVGKLYTVAVSLLGMAQVFALNLADGSLSTSPDALGQWPYWSYPDASLGETSPISFGLPSPDRPLMSTPTVATAVDEETSLTFDAVIVGAFNGTLYTVSAAPNRFRIKTNRPIDPTQPVQITVPSQPGVPTSVDLIRNQDFWIEDARAGVIRIIRAKDIGGSWLPLAGKEVQVDYRTPPPNPQPITDETHYVPLALQPGSPGVLPLPPGPGNYTQSLTAPTLLRDDVVVFGTTEVRNIATQQLVRGGCLTARSAATNTHLWSFDPLSLLPDANLTGVPYAGLPSGYAWGFYASPATDRETLYVAGTLLLNTTPLPRPHLGMLCGLQVQPSLSIRLGVPVAPQRGSLRVRPLEAPTEEILPDFYSVDYDTGVLTFVLSEAYNVWSSDQFGNRTPRGPIYGRGVQVDYLGQDGQGHVELHSVPRLTRWEYVPFVVRLNNYPVNPNPVPAFSLAGNPVTPAAFDGIRGLADFSNLPQAWGRTVRCVYFSRGIRYEEDHVVPLPLGPIVSSPLVAGNTVYVGTLPTDLDNNGTLSILEQGKVVALTLDLLTGQLWADTFPNTLPAFRNFLPDRLEFHSSPALSGDYLLIGAVVARGATLGGVFYGLGPATYWVTDSDRVVELDSDGNILSQITGTAEANPLVAAPEVSTGGAQYNLLTSIWTVPFLRPQKASRLSSGNLLVVDQGNRRVVEVDTGGKVVWPLRKQWDPQRQLNLLSGLQDFGLQEPTDAVRFYLNERVPVMDPNTGQPDFSQPPRTLSVAHTIIVDRGGYRILDVRSWVDNNGTPRYFDFDFTTGKFAEGPTVLTPETYFDPVEKRYRRLLYEQVQVWQRIGLDPPNSPGSFFPLVYVARVGNLDQLVLVAPYAPNPQTEPTRITRRFLNPDVNQWADGWLYRWFMGRVFPGLRSFEQFRQGGDYFTVLLDYAGIPTDPQSMGKGTLRLFAHTSNGQPLANWQAQEIWNFTEGDYRRALDAYLQAFIPNANQRAQNIAARVWRPVSVRKLPGQRLLVVNEGSGQALGRGGEILEIEYDLAQPRPNHARILSLIPNPDPARTYPGSYDPAVPRYAERF